MDIKSFQYEVALWVGDNFPNAAPWEPLVGLQEELGELSHSFLKHHQGIRGDEDHEAGMIDAVGDILMYLAHFCHLNAIDMEAALTTTWDKVKARDWHNDPIHGNPDPSDRPLLEPGQLPLGWGESSTGGREEK